MNCPSRVNFLKLALILLGTLSPFAHQLSAEEAEQKIPLTLKREGGWVIVESPSFRCRCQLTDSDACRLAECCEIWKSRLQAIWIGVKSPKRDMGPKCEVVVHPNRADYNLGINHVGDYSVGSTRMNFDQGRVVYRRIDLRADADDWSNAALPHELTHVMLAERFGGHALPRWADEGIAMLSESPEKHRERMTNLRSLVSRRQTLRVDEVIRLERIPGPTQRDAFYGQSVALTSFLIQRSTPKQFADFIEESQANGVSEALKKHYRIEGLSGLQSEWDLWTQKPESLDVVRLKLHDGLNPIVAFVNER